MEHIVCGAVPSANGSGSQVGVVSEKSALGKGLHGFHRTSFRCGTEGRHGVKGHCQLAMRLLDLLLIQCRRSFFSAFRTVSLA